MLAPPHLFQPIYGNGMVVIAIKNKLFKFVKSGLEFIAKVPSYYQLLFQHFFYNDILHVAAGGTIYKVENKMLKSVCNE